MKQSLLNILKFILFVGTGVTILYFVYQNQNASYMEECALQGIPDDKCSLLQKVIDDFKGANYWWLLISAICFVLSNVSRAIRWNMFIRPLGYLPTFRNSFFSVSLAYFANLGFPRLGEFVRAAVMSKYEQLPIEKVMGTIVLDRLLDVICILILSACVVIFEYDRIQGFLEENFALGDKIQAVLQSNIFLALVVLGLIGLVLLFVFRKKIMETAIYKKIATIIKGFAEGLQSIKKVDNIGLVLFHTFFIWLMYYLMTYLCFFSFTPTQNLSALAGLVVFVFGGWGIVIPSPGGMGTYHFLVIAALALYGLNGVDAFSYANINFFTIVVGATIVSGIISLILLPLMNRNYIPSHVESNSK